MSNRRVRLVYITEKLLKAKVLDSPPVWFEPLVKNPPLAPYFPPKDPGEIVLPEDPYVREVYKRHPDLLLEAYDASSFEKYPARKLAHRIMELIDMGIPKERATQIADGEFWNTRREQNYIYDMGRRRAIMEGREAPPPRKMIRRMQEREEFHLKEGLRKLKLEREAAEAAKAQPLQPVEDEFDDDDDD
ncbi:hypothetical protein KP509_02G029500 [Ceratopteris richardii]|uniref:Small ribosomal subunit protein mS23 n=1 Tax=Ceratopteris richardii TaxID=49495 RepID=A0A8T2V8C1_CERRI|nr:hypothetical protein KP509_02G029500 [Ceratopteris richardii]